VSIWYLFVQIATIRLTFKPVKTLHQLHGEGYHYEIALTPCHSISFTWDCHLGDISRLTNDFGWKRAAIAILDHLAKDTANNS